MRVVITCAVLGMLGACEDAEGAVRVRIAAIDAPIGSRALWEVTALRGGEGYFIHLASRPATAEGIPPISDLVPCDEGFVEVTARLIALEDPERGDIGAIVPRDRELLIAQAACPGSGPVDLDFTLARRVGDGFFGATGPFVGSGAVEIEGATCSASVTCDEEVAGVTLAVGCGAPDGGAVDLEIGATRLVCREARDAELFDHVVWGAIGVVDEAFVTSSARTLLGDTASSCAVAYTMSLDLEALAHQRCWLIGHAIPTRAQVATLPAASGLALRPTLQWAVEVLGPDGTMCEQSRLGSDDIDHELFVDFARREQGVRARYSSMPFGTSSSRSDGGLTVITVEPLDDEGNVFRSDRLRCAPDEGDAD